jgi:hypothetical protein
MEPRWQENRFMDGDTLIQQRTDRPSGKAVRRFWIAWLVFLLTLLAGLIVIVLIAAVAADPARISPAG